MQTPILSTKLYIPPSHQSAVSRPHLLDRLHQGVKQGHRLTLVCAPAGFGKTTLVSEWLRQSDTPAIWISLDEGDNDPLRFITYVMAAFQQVDPKIGTMLQKVLQSPQLPSMELIATYLINDLASTSTPLTFVLDDYQVIDAQPLHDLMAFLISQGPSHVHFVITSRGDPPLPLARLRTRNQMSELRSDDLRFMQSEINELLNQIIGLELPEEDITVIKERTEGWIAGLHLAALSLRKRSPLEKQAFVKTFAGDDRYIVDYLVEEVIQQLPLDLQTFLNQTAILNRFCASLCNAITGRDDSQVVINLLEQANIFIIPLDNKRQWYRYHHLFSELLRYRLQETQGDYVQALHRQASLWYEENSLTEEAIRHAVTAEDFEHAATLIERVADDMVWQGGEITTLFRWLDILPDKILQRRLRLCFYYGWTSLWTNQIHQVRARLQMISTSSQFDAFSNEAQGEAVTLQALVAYYRGDFLAAIQCFNEALVQLPEDNFIIRGPVLTMLGDAYHVTGHLAKASQAVIAASELLDATNRVELSLLTLADVIRLALKQGNLPQAVQAYHRAEQLATKWQAQTLSTFGIDKIFMAEVLYEKNQCFEANQLLQEGLALNKENFPIDQMRGYLLQTRLHIAAAEWKEAHRAFKQAQQLSNLSVNAPQVIAEVAAYQALLWLRQGNLTAVADWIQEKDLSITQVEQTDLNYVEQFTYLVFARFLIRQRNFAVALTLLSHLYQTATAHGRIRQAWECLLLQALALQAQEKQDQAETTLQQVIATTKPNGYIRLFVDEGQPMAALLTSLSAKVPHQRDYINTLLAAFPTSENNQSPSSKPPQPLPNLLTNRELEILQLMVEGKSNRDIADGLVISFETVRTHVKRIYGKLEVHRRSQAIARTRELGLF